MRAEIISVGTELLLGDIVNTNAQFLAQQLATLGYSVFYQTVVGDNVERLREVVFDAKRRSDVLIFTGGLGPTDDDLTKETVASAFGDSLIPDAEELIRLESFFKRRGAVMTDNNRKQAMVPLNGQKLPNGNGTAPGAFFRQGNKYAFLLPGPPGEMKPMFLEQVVPTLEAMQDSAIRSLTLRVFGIGESALEDKVRTLLEGTNPTAALYAKTGEVHVRITAKAHTIEQAEVMCDEYAALFRTVLGDMIYSSNGDNPETVVVKLLTAQNMQLATAESCTGGLLGERITSVSGASGVFGFGIISYANEAKQELLGVRAATLRRYGAISSQVAAEMAFGAAKRGGADFGVGITGLAGPGGGTPEKPVGLVYVAVCHGSTVAVKRVEATDRSRDYIRDIAVGQALDMLRRSILELPVTGAKTFTKGQIADFEREGPPKRYGGPVLRVLAALFLVAVVFMLLVGGVYLARSSRSSQPDLPTPSGSPSSQGLVYGTMEYTVAANRFVADGKEHNPAVNGMVALPGGQLEVLVAAAKDAGQQSLKANAAGNQLPLMAASASLATPGANVLLAGSEAFQPLLLLQDASMGAPKLSTFTFFTSRDAKVYQIFAVYLGDDDELAASSLNPTAESFARYGDFLDFFLGSKVRSLYDVPVDVTPQDSFMTLAVADPDVEGRHLYLCGRLVRQNEDPAAGPKAATGAPLMPAAWYGAAGSQPPDAGQLYAGWLRWYLTRNRDNASLQLIAGMPEKDTAPYVYPEEPPATSTPASSAPSSSASEESDGSSSGASSGSSSGSSASSSSSSATSQGAAITLSATTSPAQSASSGQAEASSLPESSSDSAAQPEQSSASSNATPRAPQRPDPAFLTVTMNGQRITGPTADILAQICQNEAASLDRTAVQALAVAAHSWIINQQGAGNEAPPVLGRPASPEVLAAVNEVSGLILSGDGTTPAFAPWFAVAATGTNRSENVWGQQRPYLSGVNSPYDQGQPGWRQIVTLSTEELALLAQKGLGIGLEATGSPDKWVTSLVRNESGYVESLVFGGRTITGVQLWQGLRENGELLLQSPAFEVEQSGDSFIFYSYGKGHGCGLSLAGAAYYAANGWGYERILSHYFPDTKVISWQ